MGANYIEANEALSKKDFLFRIKVCRKESKECRYWSRLIDLEDAPDLESERRAIVQESQELMNIFGSIIRNSE